jgi:hypothetical protein
LSLPYLGGPYCGCAEEAIAPGVGAERVLSGAYVLRLDRPFRLRRAGADAEEEVAAGTAVTLGPGDVAVYPDYAAGGEIRTAGQDELLVLGVALIAKDVSSGRQGALPRTVPSAGPLVVSTSLDWAKLPPGPVSVVLQRLTLAPGERLPPLQSDGLQAIYVEAGKLTWSFLKPGEATPAMSPGVVSQGQAFPFVYLDGGLRLLLANPYDDPAVVLVVTIAPVDDARRA